MDKYECVNILKANLEENAKMLRLEATFLFQLDQDPKYAAGIVRDWLLYHAPRQPQTPPQSPELNFKGHLRGHLGKKRRRLKEVIKCRGYPTRYLIKDFNKFELF